MKIMFIYKKNAQIIIIFLVFLNASFFVILRPLGSQLGPSCGVKPPVENLHDFVIYLSNEYWFLPQWSAAAIITYLRQTVKKRRKRKTKRMRKHPKNLHFR